jgi:microcin C transport system substrate-binding protein
VDTNQYTYQVEHFKFDMIWGMIPQSISPGNEQREFWHSKSASMVGSRNYSGIQDPVVDHLIEGLIASRNREDLVTYTRALDRVLLWNYYTIPLYGMPYTNMAHKSTLGIPQIFPTYGLAMDTFWFKNKGT